MFVGLGVFSVIPVVHGIIIDGYQTLEDRMSISLVIFHGALYIFGAVLYAVGLSLANNVDLAKY
jgi:adiponectin receptor